jgi:TonB family protein
VKLPVTFASALALHAAAAVGFAALGAPHGTSAKPDVLGQTIEIDQVSSPVVHEEEVAPVTHASMEKHSSIGAPQKAPNVVARSSGVTTPAAAATSDALPATPPAETPDTHPEPVRFKMTMNASGTGRVSSSAASTSEEVAAEGDVSERAAQVGGTKPSYPAEAIAQGVELSSPIPFEIVVDASGRVVSARPLRHAGYGFDEAAAAALRTYRFTPAKRNGHAVAVRMKWMVDFRFD